MRTGSALFLLGVWCLTRLPDLPSLWFLAVFPAVLVFALRCSWLRWPLWFLAGFLWALFRADIALDDRLEPELEGRVLTAIGEIDSLPTARDGVVRFDLRIAELGDAGNHHWPPLGKVRLSWYRAAPELVPGDRWKLTLKLKRPAGFMNPGGFDYEGWLFQQGIRATGYVVESPSNGKLESPNLLNVDRYRFAVRERLNPLFDGERRGPLIAALAVGDTGAMTSAHWRVLNRSGTTHLLAISGLHVAFFAGLCFLFAGRVWPLSASACRLLAAPHAASIAAVAGAIIYSALAGFSVPTQRSVVMIGVWMSLRVLHSQSAMSHVLALALLAVLLIDPFSALAPGFWLSFLAVAAIAWGLGNRVGQSGWWWRWGHVQWVVSVALIPILVAWFQQVPLVGIVANLVAVPWITFLAVPLILAGTMLFPIWAHAGELLLRVALWSLDLLWPFLQSLADTTWSVLGLQAPSVSALLSGTLGAAILLLPRGLPGRWLGMVWFLPLWFPPDTAPLPGEFDLALLDVGQGLSAVIRTHHHTLVYDTGPRFGADFNAGSAVVMPYLRHYGLRSIDTLVLSHGDNDHVGGLADVLDSIGVKRLLAGVPEAVPAPGATACRAGETWEWDGVVFAILHPPVNSALAGNNRSCVLRVSAAGRAALLTGDIEWEAERALVERASSALHAGVLIAPHHGSRTSSSPAFIDAVRPDVVLFPAGYRNRFGFPKKDIIVRYQRHGARVLDTGRSGAIEVRVSRVGLSIREVRRDTRRFWHSQLQ